MVLSQDSHVSGLDAQAGKGSQRCADRPAAVVHQVDHVETRRIVKPGQTGYDGQDVVGAVAEPGNIQLRVNLHVHSPDFRCLLSEQNLVSVRFLAIAGIWIPVQNIGSLKSIYKPCTAHSASGLIRWQ